VVFLLKIVSGSFEDLKKEMKLHLENVNKKIKSFEKERNRKRYLSEFEHQKLQELYSLKRIYTPTKVLPVQIDGTCLTIDSKAFHAFTKKLAKLPYELLFADDHLLITYTTGYGARGRLELYDLSRFYHDFQHIPVAVMER
jgi:hypothetical protein